MKKRGNTQKYSEITIIAFTIIIALIITMNTTQADKTEPATTLECKDINLVNGEPITTPGYGAAELCGTCFLCGQKDGVCPSDYANGEQEDYEPKKKINMREKNIFSLIELPGDTTNVMYSTGTEACNTIAGTCKLIEEYTESTWKETEITCEQDISEQDKKIRAVCNNVPKTAGCYNWPDPDCISETLKGTVYTKETNPPTMLQDAIVTISSKINPNIDPQEAQTDNEGKYLFDNEAPQGESIIRASANGYKPKAIIKTLQRGKNIVNLELTEATCSSDCTLPNIYGKEICSPECNNIHGCEFCEEEHELKTGEKVTAIEICEGIENSTKITLERFNETHVHTVDCCEGCVKLELRPKAKIKADVKNLITRDYRKKIKGQPVTLKIISYSK